MLKMDPESPAFRDLQLLVSVQDSILNIERFTGKLQNFSWQTQGQIIARQWKAFDLQMKLEFLELGTILGNGRFTQDSLHLQTRISQMNLAVFQPFLPQVKQLSGTCNTELLIYGLLNNPEARGTLEVRDLEMQVPDLNSKISRSLLKINFDRKTVAIDSIYLAMNGGNIFITGSVTHDKGQPSDINLRANIDDVKIDRPGEASVKLKSVRLNYTKQNAYYLLDGDIILGESRIIYGLRPQALLSFARSVDRPKPEVHPLIQQTRMNVRFRESENMWIDNNLARLRFHTELAFIGNLAQPNLSGRLQIEEGYVFYLDRKFQVKRGVVDFIDPNRLNPIVDLKADASIKSYQTLRGTPYTITLTLSGALDQVVVELTSVPPLEKSNIVALLTVGATREQLTSKDTAGKGTSVAEVLRERMEVLSSQRISSYASRKIGSFLGLEKMTIEGNLFQFGKSWGPELLASKKLSNRMEVTYSTTVGHMNEQSIRLDYRLSKYFSVRGQTDQRSRSSIDLKYGLKFK